MKVQKTGLNARQFDLLEFVRQHSGCSKWEAACFDFPAAGHSASYARIDRLIKRGLLRGQQGKTATKYQLSVTSKGLQAMQDSKFSQEQVAA